MMINGIGFTAMFFVWGKRR